jgi:hypothetical protein
LPKAIKKQVEYDLPSNAQTIALKFIELLQTHPDFQTKKTKHSRAAILKGAEVGLSIAEYLTAAVGNDKSVL